jgi:hypothetical protein
MAEDMKTVIFIFAGREKYMSIQMPYFHRILDKNPNYELHLWNFSRNSNDHQYLQGLPLAADQIKLFNDYYEGDNQVKDCIKSPSVLCGCVRCRPGKWTEPYKFYANSSDYDESTVFLKLDDDIIFIDENGLNNFIASARGDRSHVYSANVINNGVCSFYDKSIRKIIDDRGLGKALNLNKSMGMIKRIFFRKKRLQNWWLLCTSKAYFNLSHDYFIDNIKKIISQREFSVSRTFKSRFSINALAISKENIIKISKMLSNEVSLNDEQIISHGFNIKIFHGFICSHLHFADQRAAISDSEEDYYLSKYNNISKISFNN